MDQISLDVNVSGFIRLYWPDKLSYEIFAPDLRLTVKLITPSHNLLDIEKLD
jgi:hypothetical protein